MYYLEYKASYVLKEYPQKHHYMCYYMYQPVSLQFEFSDVSTVEVNVVVFWVELFVLVDELLHEVHRHHMVCCSGELSGKPPASKQNVQVLDRG